MPEYASYLSELCIVPCVTYTNVNLLEQYYFEVLGSFDWK